MEVCHTMGKLQIFKYCIALLAAVVELKVSKVLLSPVNEHLPALYSIYNYG